MKDLFHADFLFDKRELEKVHYFIASIRAFEVNIRPAINAMPGKNGRAIEKVPGGGTMVDQVAIVIREQNKPGATIIRKTIFAQARSLGYKPNSILTNNLIQNKVIKKTARGQFVVLPKVLALPAPRK